MRYWSFLAAKIAVASVALYGLLILMDGYLPHGMVVKPAAKIHAAPRVPTLPGAEASNQRDVIWLVPGAVATPAEEAKLLAAAPACGVCVCRWKPDRGDKCCSSAGPVSNISASTATARCVPKSCRFPAGNSRNGRPTPAISGRNCAARVKIPLLSGDAEACVVPNRTPGNQPAAWELLVYLQPVNPLRATGRPDSRSLRPAACLK